eukprot:449817_1
MASFPIATLPKFQGGPNGHIHFCNNSINMICEEDALIMALQQIKSYNNNTRTLFYLNTYLNFPYYNLSTYFYGKNEKYLLHDNNGNLVWWSKCYPSRPNVTVFDLSQNETRNLWLSTIKYALTKYPNVVDGIYADSARAKLQDDLGCYNWSQQQINQWNQGHILLIQETMNIVKTINPHRGIVIGNNADINGVNGRMFESFRTNDSRALPPGNDLNVLMNDNGIRITEVHDDKCNCLNGSFQYNQTLSAYLIGAYKYSYYGCSNGFGLQNDWDEIWQNIDYYKPLGEPIMNATFNNMTRIYYREFNKGVKVWLDEQWQFPCISWNDGSFTGKIVDCKNYITEQ